MAQEGKVVVVVRIHTEHLPEFDVWAASIDAMGIEGYKKTEAEAIALCKEMFAERISAYRRFGNLKVWLDRFDVEWDWENQYAGELEVEDVSMPSLINDSLVQRLNANHNLMAIPA